MTARPAPEDPSRLMWDFTSICLACSAALRHAAEQRDAEHAPYGVDALDEISLHYVIRSGLSDAGYIALAEQRYPDHRARPRRSDGDRCDITLIRDADAHLLDPLAADTLFGQRGAEPGDACWIEVKFAHQHSLTDGVAGPSRAYSAQLLSAAIADLRKLARDRVITFAALLLIMFNADEQTAEHDLAAWLGRCLDLDLPIRTPSVERFGITDRIGNSVCTVALVPVRATRDH